MDRPAGLDYSLLLKCLLGSRLHGSWLLKQLVELMSLTGFAAVLTHRDGPRRQCLPWGLLLQCGLSVEFLCGSFWKWSLELSSFYRSSCGVR